MTVKTITITEEAYDVIRSMKNEGESFSELFKRIGKRHLIVNDIVGILKQDKKEGEDFKLRVAKIRDDLSKDMERRIDDVRTRFKRANRTNQ